MACLYCPRSYHSVCSLSGLYERCSIAHSMSSYHIMLYVQNTRLWSLLGLRALAFCTAVRYLYYTISYSYTRPFVLLYDTYFEVYDIHTNGRGLLVLCVVVSTFTGVWSDSHYSTCIVVRTFPFYEYPRGALLPRTQPKLCARYFVAGAVVFRSSAGI